MRKDDLRAWTGDAIILFRDIDLVEFMTIILIASILKAMFGLMWPWKIDDTPNLN